MMRKCMTQQPSSSPRTAPNPFSRKPGADSPQRGVNVAHPSRCGSFFAVRIHAGLREIRLAAFSSSGCGLSVALIWARLVHFRVVMICLT